MKQSEVQKIALSLPQTTEEPHFNRSSFRIRGKVFATAIPNEHYLNIIASDSVREPALKIYADCLEPLVWGKKVLGLRVNLLKARSEMVSELLELAWKEKAPKSAIAQHRESNK